MKTLHIFSDDYLERCKKLSIEERLDYIENYKLMNSEEPFLTSPISLKIPEPLLYTFKQKAKLEGIAYQTKIKELMKGWVNNEL